MTPPYPRESLYAVMPRLYINTNQHFFLSFLLGILILHSKGPRGIVFNTPLKFLKINVPDPAEKSQVKKSPGARRASRGRYAAPNRREKKPRSRRG